MPGLTTHAASAAATAASTALPPPLYLKRPVPPPGYFLHYETNELANDTCWLYREKFTRVALIDVRDKLCRAVFVGTFHEMQNKDPQTLLISACAYDRLTTSTKG